MVLPLAFVFVALLYASAGFGGGSTYTALLVAAEMDYRVLPLISLICNLVVVSGGVWHFVRAGHLKWRRVAPIIAISMPAAWLGGKTPIPEVVFLGILGLALLIAGIAIWREPQVEKRRVVSLSPIVTLSVGGGIGYLSGLVGIGGGIFLSPLLHLIGWDSPRRIAATASFFILANSAAGLLGHIQKNEVAVTGVVAEHWPLLLAVLVGGQIGSRLGAAIVAESVIRRITATLVLIVALRLLWTTLRLATGAA